MRIRTPQYWKSYELIDSGEFEKLERFGKYILRRPEPQAVWGKSMRESEWLKLQDARFVQQGSSSGKWEKGPGNMPDQWQMDYQSKALTLRFRLALTGFKHVGIFPEQADNWEFIYEQASKISKAKVLNLFAYTGGASLAARAAGADVTHCDSIRQVVNWANSNMQLSKLDNIRWLIEDAFKFVSKEAKRGRTYQGIILDPPAWGHGPKGEKWKLEEQINELIRLTSSILDPKRHFLVFNSYSMGFSALIPHNLIGTHFGQKTADRADFGELCLQERSGRKLPAGVYVRFSSK
jgi:23S rRNA (cytosine1962-C5)-methyltransferase